jgi:hypothetical protein
MMRVSIRTGWLMGLLLLAACDGGEDGDNNGGNGGGNQVRRPGIGPSTEAPEGSAFTLPAGLTITQPIPGWDGVCAPEEEARGTGGQVRLCLTLTNASAGDIVLALPEGLVFPARDNGIQNGLLLQSVTIPVSAGQRITVPLFLYSINLSRTGSQPKDFFSLGPITQDAAVREVLQLVANKDTRDLGNGIVVQSALWHATDSEGLTAQDRANIATLPPR